MFGCAVGFDFAQPTLFDPTYFISFSCFSPGIYGKLHVDIANSRDAVEQPLSEYTSNYRNLT